MIEHYSFGSLTFKGQNYIKDLIILRTQEEEKVFSSWWRKEGHKLHVEDLEEIWDKGIKFLIVGMGANGLMQVTPEVETKAKQLDITLEAYPTAKATERFNELYSKGVALAGAFHLTC
ncbi:Mth938-like domain-containing protein [Thermodesulfobacterium thermophilum]|uniref:Mth938-like domain-containing protein n=1 Tax=Thermodesulfobacterium thermophilum TaxID=886 RepID=UPI0003B409E3|nr:MTH938/NDUFAF3 family protein [Thermodesulfobacterium thermophilum]